MKQQKFGVEEEVFLIEEVGLSKGKPQKELMKAFAEAEQFRVVAVDHDGLPLQINKDVAEGGYISIKFDSTYNIFEIAYPPTGSLQNFQGFTQRLWAKLQSHGKNLGLTFERRGYRNFDLQTEDFFSKDSVQQTLTRPSSGKSHFDRFYPGKICSTQIHLDLKSDEAFAQLRYLYALEPLIPMLFSNSQVSGVAHCYRLLTLQDAFRDDYHFFGFPKEIPTSQQHYDALVKKSVGFWRDYSSIVPRAHGTWEFRSTCIQATELGTVEVAAFRLAVLNCMRNPAFCHMVAKLENPRAVYMQACLNLQSPNVANYFNQLGTSGVLQLIAHEMDKLGYSGSSNKLKDTRKIA